MVMGPAINNSCSKKIGLLTPNSPYPKRHLKHKQNKRYRGQRVSREDASSRNLATMAALQSFTPISLSSNSFLGQRLPLLSSYSPPLIKYTEAPPCLIVMRLKRWERKECKPNSLPLLHKMHVKVGDTVKVISGREKGKIGEVSAIFKHNSTVLIKEINLKTKHVKSKEQGEPGQIIKIEAPIHSSNVMLYSKEQNVASRVGHKILEDGTKVRYLVKTGEVIDSVEKWKELLKNKEKTELVAASTAASS